MYINFFKHKFKSPSSEDSVGLKQNPDICIFLKKVSPVIVIHNEAENFCTVRSHILKL